MAAGRKALVVATYAYADSGLSRLTAPAHDAESLASVLEDPAIAGFDVTMLVNKPHYEVGEAIADFYGGARRDDLTLLYFTGHGVKDDEGRLYLAMTNTRRSALMFTAIGAAQLNDAMDASPSRRKVLILDCCYSGAFPAGRTAKSDEGVQTLERFQGKGRAVLTASDATQYAFEGDDVRGSGTSSVFTRHLVEAISSGAADLDEDGDIALDELYSYVYEQVVAELPQQRPKKQEDVDGRILIARNVHWSLPGYIEHAVESPIAAQRLSAVQELERLHQVGNEVVRSTVAGHLGALAADDSRSVSAAATALLDRIREGGTQAVVPRPRGAVEASPVDVAPVAVAPVAVEVEAPEPDAAEAERAAADRAEAQRVEAQRPEAARAEAARAEAARAEAARAEAARAEAARAEATRAEAARAEAERVALDRPAAALVSPSPAPPAARVRGELSIWLLLGLLAAGGLLLLGARLSVFESVYGQYAEDLGFGTAAWAIWVGIPLLVAGQLLVLRGSVPWASALAVGLVAGATLTQLQQVLRTTGLMLDADDEFDAGPGWWLALLGTVVLGTAVVLAIRRPPFRDRPAVQRSGRAAGAVILLFAALAAWMSAYGDSYLWFADNAAALLLFAVALPVALFRLSPAQRLAGLVAVTVLGGWLTTTVLERVVRETFWDGAGTGVAISVSALVSVTACYLAQTRMPARAAGVADDEPPRPTSGLGSVTSLLLGGGVLLLLSRFLVFESTSSNRVSEIVPWVSWLVGAGVPLAVALLLLVSRSDDPRGVPLAGGLVGAAALGQLDLVLATGRYWIHPDNGELAGPGWWVTLLGALVLSVCAVRVLRRPELRSRPRFRRDWRALVAVAVVVASLLAWLGAFRWGRPWFTANEPALMLAAVCLPVAALGLRPAQRILGLATVTVLAPWMASGHVRALVEEDFNPDAQAALVGILAAACSLAACYLSQWRRPDQPRDDAAEVAASRRAS